MQQGKGNCDLTILTGKKDQEELNTRICKN